MLLKDKVGDLIKNYDGITEAFFYGEAHYYPDRYLTPFTQAGLAVELVDKYGGEGEGDRYDKTWKFTFGDDSVFVRFWGWYESYNGAHYEHYIFVTPKQRMVTEYV